MPDSFTGIVSNTVIGVIVTNAKLTKGAANKIAQMAHDGLARAVRPAVRPAHTMFDGDTIFALSTGKGQIANVNAIGSFAAEASAQAIVNAVQEATSLGDVPALRDLSHIPKFKGNL
jgi:L-aminopeptidase/D-esterase-like protein